MGSNFFCLATKSPSARYATVGLLVMASSGADQPGGCSVGGADLGSGSEPSRADCIISNCCCCCFGNCELVGWSPPAEQRELASHLECCCAQENIGSHRGLCRMLRLEKRNWTPVRKKCSRSQSSNFFCEWQQKISEATATNKFEWCFCSQKLHVSFHLIEFYKILKSSRHPYKYLLIEINDLI